MFKFDMNFKDLLKASKLMSQFPDKALKSVQKTIEEEAETVRAKWRDKSDHNQMPGTFGSAWKKKKAELGFKTNDLQRFGRGDSRSYYENIAIISYKPNGGAFVGLPEGTPGYTNSGRLGPMSLDRIAEYQETYHPIWQELLNMVLDELPNKFEANFLKDMRELGFVPGTT